MDISSALREISITQDDSNGLEKRWFSCSEMDLFVWFDQHGDMQELQLTVDKQETEKAVIWSLNKGISVNVVDGGARPGKHPGSPIFKEVEGINIQGIVNRFQRLAINLESVLVREIEEILSCE